MLWMKIISESGIEKYPDLEQDLDAALFQAVLVREDSDSWQGLNIPC